jgi:hypothetical protein
MRDVKEFRSFLKRKGKENHVVDALTKSCGVFEQFLIKRQKLSLDVADKEDTLAFFDAIKDQKADVGNLLRAVSLYYKFKSKSELSAFASKLRQQRISSTKKPFELKNFRGANPEYADRLSAVGIKNTEQILKSGKTHIGRQKLSTRQEYQLMQYWSS